MRRVVSCRTKVSVSVLMYLVIYDEQLRLTMGTQCFIIKVMQILTEHSHVLQSVLHHRVDRREHDYVLMRSRGEYFKEQNCAAECRSESEQLTANAKGKK